MNKVKIKIFAAVFLAFILSASNLMSQSGWYPLQPGTSNELKSIFFLNANTGFLSGNNIVLKTSNGGINWQIISQTFGGTSVSFINANTGIVCEGTLYRTINGGATWVNSNLSSLKAVYFYNSLTGYAVGDNSQALITADAGQNWFVQNIPLNYNKFNKILFTSPGTGYVIGGRQYFPFYGVIYKTTNSGGNWRQIDSQAEDVEFSGIAFPNPTTGYLVGRNEYGSNGVIYKTTNAGENWIQVGIYQKDLNDVSFPSNQVGYAVGQDGTILKSVDGSSLWTLQQSNTTLDINSVQFLQDDLGFTAGNSGTAQKTVNGGTPGPPFAIGGHVFIQGIGSATSGHVKALKYNLNSNSIEVVDSASVDVNGNYMLRNVRRDTVDIAVFPDDEDKLVGPEFVPTYYGGINTGTIYWQYSQSLVVNGNIFNIDVHSFPVVNTGGPRITSGGVYTTPPNINGLKDAVVYAMSGNNFVGFGVSGTGGPYSVNNMPSGSFHFICDRMGYRSVSRDTIVGVVNVTNFNFYLTSVFPIGITQTGNEIPKTFRLEQNYPNPFNPSTKINIAVSSRSAVKLVVYDMLGRQVETLVNEELSPGTYNISWDASKYSSGIYLYRMITSDFTDTKKMILMK